METVPRGCCHGVSRVCASTYAPGREPIGQPPAGAAADVGPDLLVVAIDDRGIGRPALAVALNDTLYGERSELLFDPKTSALLGERSVVVKPPPEYHVKPGTVSEGATYITAGIVERIGQVPTR